MVEGEEPTEARIRRMRARAEEIRTFADEMKYPGTRVTMFQLAETYDRFADWLEGKQYLPSDIH
jgi:hypothetical protein